MYEPSGLAELCGGGAAPVAYWVHAKSLFREGLLAAIRGFLLFVIELVWKGVCCTRQTGARLCTPDLAWTCSQPTNGPEA